jgi:hypothetical protein
LFWLLCFLVVLLFFVGFLVCWCGCCEGVVCCVVLFVCCVFCLGFVLCCLWVFVCCVIGFVVVGVFLCGGCGLGL